MTRPDQDCGEQWRRRGRGGAPEPLIMQEEKGGGVKEALRYLGKQGCRVPHQGTNVKEKVSVGHPEGISQARPGWAAVTKSSKSQRGNPRKVYLTHSQSLTQVDWAPSILWPRGLEHVTSRVTEAEEREAHKMFCGGQTWEVLHHSHPTGQSLRSWPPPTRRGGCRCRSTWTFGEPYAPLSHWQGGSRGPWKW